MPTNVRSALGAVVALSLCACGASSAPTTRSAESTQEPAAKEAAEPKVAENVAENKGPQDESEADPLADGLRKASRPPNELITGPNLIYMFNFKESAVGQAAKEHCMEQAADSPRDLAACMEKARSKVAVESVRFIKDPSGQHWWVTYNRYKGNLLKWHKVRYQPGEEKDDRITLNLFGKDEGIAPMPRVPRSLLVELPNDYTIIVEHPDHGAMMYDAKVGMLEDEPEPTLKIR